jgi:hypothetical protein
LARTTATPHEQATVKQVVDRRRRRATMMPMDPAATEPRVSQYRPRQAAPQGRGGVTTEARRRTAARILARHEIDQSEFLHQVCRCGRPWPCDLVRYARLLAGNAAITTVRPGPAPTATARQLECLAASLCEPTEAAAARALGMSRAEVAALLSTLYLGLGVNGRSGSDRKLAAARAIGWLVVPRGG